MELKYIMNDKYEWAIFASSIPHDKMELPGEVESAGFCKFLSSGEVVCYGKSISRGLHSRPEDADIINAHLRA